MEGRQQKGQGYTVDRKDRDEESRRGEIGRVWYVPALHLEHRGNMLVPCFVCEVCGCAIKNASEATAYCSTEASIRHTAFLGGVVVAHNECSGALQHFELTIPLSAFLMDLLASSGGGEKATRREWQAIANLL